MSLSIQLAEEMDELLVEEEIILSIINKIPYESRDKILEYKEALKLKKHEFDKILYLREWSKIQQEFNLTKEPITKYRYFVVGKYYMIHAQHNIKKSFFIAKLLKKEKCGDTCYFKLDLYHIKCQSNINSKYLHQKRFNYLSYLSNKEASCELIGSKVKSIYITSNLNKFFISLYLTDMQDGDLRLRKDYHSDSDYEYSYEYEYEYGETDDWASE